MIRLTPLFIIWLALAVAPPALAAEAHDWQLVELTGRVEEFYFNHNWRAYYWRDDFALRLREEKTGRAWQVISREPTPWCDLRLGTTYTGLKVDWSGTSGSAAGRQRPLVRVVGVKAIDRTPQDFYGWKLDPDSTVTAFIVWVDADGSGQMKEWFINNWFHTWGKEADVAILKHYADKERPYDVYGHFGGIAAPFSRKSQAIVDAARPKGAYIYHALVRSTKGNPVGYELEVIHLLGRDPATKEYGILHGGPGTLVKLDGSPPPEAAKPR
ncbi:MAG: hypothetical protein FJ290_15410 [Planctomycetes bacterium]|nr:hypothetical protein [Planctomycetota bacterium]